MVTRKKIKQPLEESTFEITKIKENEIATFKFSKHQLVTSKKYSLQRDILNALLVDGQVYTFGEVDQKLNDFLKGKVKK